MSVEPVYTYTPPGYAVSRWLADPGPHVPPHIRDVLLRELFTTPSAVLMGVVNGVLLNAVAVLLCPGPLFLGFMCANVAMAAIRQLVVSRTIAAARAGRSTPTDLYIVTGISWCALQGAVTFAAMQSGLHSLQFLFSTSIFGMLGPICARNYPAPRLALVLVCACELPLTAAAVLSRDPWMLTLLVQTPVYIYGAMTITARFQSMAVASLTAQHHSDHDARHDALTGLLNRAGLTDYLSRQDRRAASGFILFYLDLDGFKAINDTFGHQTGDSLLQAVAQRLRSSTRASDIVARLGGDEFVIVAPGMAPGAGSFFAESVIRRIADQPYVLGTAGPLRIGVSIGFACAPEDGTALDELHSKADAALYSVKGAGKGLQRRFAAA